MRFHRKVFMTMGAIAMIAAMVGCGKSSTATAPESTLDTTPPPAVLGVSMIRSGSDRILIWEANAAPDLAYYEVFTATSVSTGYNYEWLGSATQNQYQIPAYSNSDGFAVRAVDSSGNRSAYTIYYGNLDDFIAK